MLKIFVITLLTSWLSAAAQPDSARRLYLQALDDFQKKEYPSYYLHIKKAHELHPYHQGILYHLGIASSLAGRPDEAIAYLKRAIEINADFELDNNAALGQLKQREDFKRLLDLQAQLKVPVVHSDTAFVLHDRQLHPEGITYDRRTQTFYATSVHKRKIVSIDMSGNASDFTASEENGMGAVLGLRVDNKSKFLWACSSAVPEMQDYDSTLPSAVFKFDLNSKSLLKKFVIPKSFVSSVFGDLLLNRKGIPFISDSKNNIIFTVNGNDSVLKEFFTSKEFWSIQGIAFSEDEKTLFIADYIKGLFALSMNTKELQQISSHVDVSLKGIDGLTYYNHSLIAIQNGVYPKRVTRYYLDKKERQIEGFEIIDSNHPAFNEPTSGTLAGNMFYYVANSQWNGYKDGKILDKEQLQDIIILKSVLK